jgi:membrane-associated phospholipid phosphatase
VERLTRARPKQPARPAAQGTASPKQAARPAAQGTASPKQAARPAAQGKAFLIAAAGAAAAFGALLVVAYLIPGGRWLDASALEGFVAANESFVSRVAHAVVQLGNPPEVGVIAVGLAALALGRGRPRVAAFVIVLLAATSVSSQVLKALLAHPRPDALTAGGHVAAEAFPSGHATAAMSLALAAVVAAPRRARPAAAVLGSALALAVGVSVVLLGWHFPSDVIGGFLLATGWALVLVAGLRELDRRRPARAPRRTFAGSAARAFERVTASGIDAAALALTALTVVTGAALLLTHPAEIVAFGRAHTVATVVGAGLALAALTLPFALARALATRYRSEPPSRPSSSSAR